MAFSYYGTALRANLALIDQMLSTGMETGETWYVTGASMKVSLGPVPKPTPKRRTRWDHLNSPDDDT